MLIPVQRYFGIITDDIVYFISSESAGGATVKMIGIEVKRSFKTVLTHYLDEPDVVSRSVVIAESAGFGQKAGISKKLFIFHKDTSFFINSNIPRW